MFGFFSKKSKKQLSNVVSDASVVKNAIPSVNAPQNVMRSRRMLSDIEKRLLSPENPYRRNHVVNLAIKDDDFKYQGKTVYEMVVEYYNESVQKYYASDILTIAACMAFLNKKYDVSQKGVSEIIQLMQSTGKISEDFIFDIECMCKNDKSLADILTDAISRYTESGYNETESDLVYDIKGIEKKYDLLVPDEYKTPAYIDIDLTASFDDVIKKNGVPGSTAKQDLIEWLREWFRGFAEDYLPDRDMHIGDLVRAYEEFHPQIEPMD